MMGYNKQLLNRLFRYIIIYIIPRMLKAARQNKDNDREVSQLVLEDDQITHCLLKHGRTNKPMAVNFHPILHGGPKQQDENPLALFDKP